MPVPRFVCAAAILMPMFIKSDTRSEPCAAGHSVFRRQLTPDDQRQSGICCEDAGRGAFVIVFQVQDTLPHDFKLNGELERVCDIPTRRPSYCRSANCRCPRQATRPVDTQPLSQWY